MEASRLFSVSCRACCVWLFGLARDSPLGARRRLPESPTFSPYSLFVPSQPISSILLVHSRACLINSVSPAAMLSHMLQVVHALPAPLRVGQCSIRMRTVLATGRSSHQPPPPFQSLHSLAGHLSSLHNYSPAFIYCLFNVLINFRVMIIVVTSVTCR